MNRTRSLLTVLVCAVAPVVMGPWSPICPDCGFVASWSGALEASTQKTYEASIEDAVTYRAELHPDDWGGTIGVLGDVADVSCEYSGMIHLCEFTATANGTAYLKVGAGSNAIAYDLYLTLPE